MYTRSADIFRIFSRLFSDLSSAFAKECGDLFRMNTDSLRVERTDFTTPIPARAVLSIRVQVRELPIALRRRSNVQVKRYINGQFTSFVFYKSISINYQSLKEGVASPLLPLTPLTSFLVFPIFVPLKVTSRESNYSVSVV